MHKTILLHLLFDVEVPTVLCRVDTNSQTEYDLLLKMARDGVTTDLEERMLLNIAEQQLLTNHVDLTQYTDFINIVW